MLELVWPGKQASLALCSHPVNAGWIDWHPASIAPVKIQPQTTADHRLFAADNLDALRLFRDEGVRYDVIYIDPPYNTGGSFTYKDKASSSALVSSELWLNSLYPRMHLAREILDETGILFVSIDDNEVCHLLTILREIFGRENHLGTIKWRRKRKPSFLDKHLSSTLEYVLVFAKNSAVCPRLLGQLTQESTRPVLNAANRVVERIIPAQMEAHCQDGLYAPGEYRNRSLTFSLLDQLEIKNGRVVHDTRISGPFRIQQEQWAQTGFITRNFGLRRRVLASEQKRRHAVDDGTTWPTNEDAQEELKNVFGNERVFDFPKPVGLLTELLSMISFAGVTGTQRCLDFYAGSGSFLIAALEQSRIDGVRRRVDLVQSRETVRGNGSQQFSDIAEICAYRITVDSLKRGFEPSFSFLQLQQ